MSDVKIKFSADFADINLACAEIARLSKKTAKDVKAPFENILEADKKVERSMGNIAKSIASAATPSDALAAALDNMENSINTPLYIGAAAAIGVSLYNALTDAAKGANHFHSEMEKLLKIDAFSATSKDIDGMRSKMDDLANDIQDDGLFEKWIFGKSKEFLKGKGFLEEWFYGSSKEEALQSMEQSFERSREIARKTREKMLADEMSALRARTRIAGLSNSATDVSEAGDIASEETAMQSREDAKWAELNLRHIEEAKKATDELQRLKRVGSKEEVAHQTAMISEIEKRQEIEARALDQEIAKAQDRRKLENEMYYLSQKQAIEQLGFLSEREKLELNLEQSGERLALLSSSRGATEKEINAALLDQAKIKQDIATLDKAELDASASISRVLLERRQLGKSDLDQQKFKINMLQAEADEMEMNIKGKKDQEALEKKLNDIQAERLNLKEMERQEEEKIRDVARERIQMAERDPYVQAENESKWAQEDAQRTMERGDASESEKQQALLNAERARQNLIQAAAGAGPSLNDVAGTDADSMRALRREANRGGLDRASQARQAAAQQELAARQRAKDPYDQGNRARSDRLNRKGEINAARSQGILDQRLDSEDRAKLEEMSPTDFKNEIDRRRAEKESRAREKEAAAERSKWERENPLDAKKKREGKPYDDSKDPEKVGQNEEPKTGQAGAGQEQDPMLAALQSIAAWSKSTGVLDSIDKKLPIEITN